MSSDSKIKNLPLVSVLINNYNYSRFLNKAIASALNQTYPHVEVVVVDDGSTDDSQEIIRSYGDRIIPVLKENGGQSSAFNAGFEYSTGELLFFLDSDDIFLPNKVEKFVNWFSQITLDNQSILIFDTLEIIDGEGERVDIDPLSGSCEWKDLHGAKERKKYLDSSLTQVSTSVEVFKHASKYRYIPYLGSPTSGLAMTRILAARIFPLTGQNIKISGDDFLVKAASLMGDIYSVEDVLTQYRVHGNNNWYSHKKTVKKEFLQAVDTFLNSKLKHSNRKAVFSYFDSVHAQVYYQGHCSDQHIYSRELLKLAVRAISWHVNWRTIKLLVKATYLVVHTRFKINK